VILATAGLSLLAKGALIDPDILVIPELTLDDVIQLHARFGPAIGVAESFESGIAFIRHGRQVCRERPRESRLHIRAVVGATGCFRLLAMEPLVDPHVANIPQVLLDNVV